MPNIIRVGVIGYGYWGPNLVRNFTEHGSCVVHKVADLSIERRAVLKKYYPLIKSVVKADEIYADAQIDAVVIATPVHTHFKLAQKALENNKHVLIEKPMTTSLRDAEALVTLANKKKKIIMVDHTFLYTDAISKIKKYIDRGEIGALQYFDSMRTNLGIFQPDVNVLWDLATHDIAILNYLVHEKPLSIQATGISHTRNKIHNIGFLTIKYESGLIAHFNCSWSTPIKIRTIILGGTKKMIVYNDVEPTEKIKIYDKGYSVKKHNDNTPVQIDYRDGDIYIPKIELKEALTNLVNDFVSAILKKTKPISSGQCGIDVVKILALADTSLKKQGKEIPFS